MGQEHPLDAIQRFIPLGDSLATAGQPTEEQLADVAAAGYEVVINLGLHDDPSYALVDERASVEALGMAYVHIPVRFATPQLEDLAQFRAAMEDAGDRKVFVHCRHNKRVPVFVALDRVLRQGLEADRAFATMREAWEPDATWQAFIEQALSSRA